MVNCCVPFCTVRSDCEHYFSNGERISLHGFPKDLELLVMWMKAISRQREKGSFWSPSENSAVCSRHFHVTCFVEGTKMSVLKEDSVPTIFQDYPTRKQHLNSYKPYARRQETSLYRLEHGFANETLSKPSDLDSEQDISSDNTNAADSPTSRSSKKNCFSTKTHRQRDIAHPSKSVVQTLQASLEPALHVTSVSKTYSGQEVSSPGQNIIRVAENKSIPTQHTPEIATETSRVIKIGNEYYLCTESTNEESVPEPTVTPRMNFTSGRPKGYKHREFYKRIDTNDTKQCKSVSTQTQVTCEQLREYPQVNRNLQVRMSKYKKRIEDLSQMLERETRLNKMMSEWLHDDD